MSQRKKEIRIKVNETEHNLISNNAKKFNMQVAPFVRMVGQNPIIQQYDYSKISEHTKEIAKVRNSINQLIFTIEASNNYLPREIKNIVEMMNEIFESENKLLQTLRTDRIRQYEKDRIAFKNNNNT